MESLWISTQQIARSLEELRAVHPFFGMSLLAFKARGIPVGSQTRLNFAKLMREFLSEYYQPSATYTGYYNPFKTSDPSNRWLTSKYPSGALQRITVDTFGGAIIHEKNTTQWGWVGDYIPRLNELLEKTKSSRVSDFHLSVWLFRNYSFKTSITPLDLVEIFKEKFNISEEEMYFDLSEPPISEVVKSWLTDDPTDNDAIIDIIGWPPGEKHKGSIKLNSLDIVDIGPTKSLRYEPAKRINILTGDNSLGKTFLLECIWWSITGNWGEFPAAPRQNSNNKSPKIEFSIGSTKKRAARFVAEYNWNRQHWDGPLVKDRPKGLAIYARYDGSYLVWDTSRPPQSEFEGSSFNQISLSREELWDGKELKDRHGRTAYICNGLIRDWVSWQTRGERFDEIFSTFIECLDILSPSEVERLTPDEPILMPNSSREIPTLRMKYGSVPILHASAGVQRIVGLAYFIVWAWFEHKKNSTLARKDPQDEMVLLIDEIEAHLHPKWQRAIVPSIYRVIERLADNLNVQVHIATHSPLVLASAESVFELSKDALHHLSLDGESVSIENVEFQKHGSVDAWLMSDIFGLRHARSIVAERAIEAAKQLQLSNDPDPEDVQRVNAELLACLRDDDEFWPRWRYFAETNLPNK